MVEVEKARPPALSSKVLAGLISQQLH